jgi:hypothetical protein
VARDVAPDVVVHDPMELSAPLIGGMHGRPRVGVGYLLVFRPVGDHGIP